MVHRAVMVAVLAFGLLLPATASAATATTGGATAIANNSATLNGSVSTTSSDSAYRFQYGTSPSSLTQTTTPKPIGAVSSQAVTANLTGLQSGTTYYYNLVVVENVSNSTPTTTTGSTLNFTTTGSSAGGTIATTGSATSVTSTSATLNGVANPIAGDSGWAFQYGTSTNYGKLTTVHAIGTGPHAVSETVSGLKPGTTYHFRLVVNQGTYPRSNVLGADQTFTTKSSGGGGGKKKIGKASLRSHRLKVHKGKVAIPLKCTGPAGKRCKGKVSITSRGKINGKKKTVNCGKAKFSIKTGKKKTLHARIGAGCATLLNSSPKHKIGATLKIVFSTGQPRLKTHVTLFLG